MSWICRVWVGVLGSMAMVLAADEAVTTITLTDAVTRTVAQDPGVKVEAVRVERSEGTVQAAGGLFDWTMLATYSRERRRAPVAWPTTFYEVSARTETTTAVGATRLFRNGVRLTPSIGVVELDDFLTQPYGNSRGEIKLALDVPLLRGRGEDATGANELAAHANRDAIFADTRHRIAARLFNTIRSFWECRAATDQLAIREDTERRASEVLDMVARLVDGGEIEPVILEEAKGDVLTKKAQTTSSRLELYQRRLRLAVAMGYGTEEQDNAPLAGGTFPPVRVVDDVMTRAPGLVRMAMTNRGDFLATQEAMRAYSILVTQARNGELPRLDVTVELSYLGLDDNPNATVHGAVTEHLTGVNSYAGIEFEVPLGNNVAKGVYRQRQADYDQAHWQSIQLAQTIAAEVRVALASFQAAQESWQQAHDSVRSLALVVDSTRRKVSEGEASLNSLVEQENRYVDARILEIDALANYTVSLVNLHFVTGNLLRPEERDAIALDLGRLQTLP